MDQAFTQAQEYSRARAARIPILRAALVDLLFLLVSFFSIHALKYGTIVVSNRHGPFLLLVVLSWLILSVILKKFSTQRGMSLRECLGVVVIQAGFMVGLVSLCIVLLGLTGMSRVLVYGTIFLYAALDTMVLVVYANRAEQAPAAVRGRALPAITPSYSPSLLFVFFDALFLFLAFFLATLWKRGQFQWSDYTLDALFMLYGVWLVISLLTRKFEKCHFTSLFSSLTLALKCSLLWGFGLAVLVFSFQYYYLSRFQLFGTAAVFSALELGLFVLYYRYRSYRKDQEAPANKDALFLGRQHVLPPSNPAADASCADPVDEKIHHALQFLEPELYDFIKKHLDLGGVDFSQTALMFTNNLFNVKVLENSGHKLIVNLHKINDIRFLNRYFLLVHAALTPHGWVVGKAHTLETHRTYVSKRFSQPYAGFLYGVDFIWNRMIPKLPIAKKLYFGLTQGRNRTLSKAEILGRLSFCGFRAVAEMVINDRYYFIAQKVMTPSPDPHPTYGPLVALPRFGFQEKPITIYKFRTMHPYSEYLQEYVYEHNHLQSGGKFKNDFRVTGWGAMMRRLWIDELPMLYNWFRGQLQLVGVRPLSPQYLELYSPELRELRRRVKPGVVPPFYADMPKTFAEICDSERRYIEAFLKKPFRTSWRYFWRAVWNIAFKGARSR